MRHQFRLWTFVVAAIFLGGCAGSGVSHSRKIASDGKTFDQAMSDLGLNVYFANLHSHHFMEYHKKGGIENLGPGPCDANGTYPQDDAKPCRNNDAGVDSFVMPRKLEDGTPDRLDYFRQACTYGRDVGGLDILFISPHTKDGDKDPNPVTSTGPKALEDRHAMLAEINGAYKGKYYCGLGQEASSISTGNHMNILGQFPQDSGVTQPFFFSAGHFDELYPQIKTRMAGGEKVVVQLNHPDVRDDLWWKDYSQASNKAKKELLNDYGLDDYPPVSCLVKGVSSPGCDKFQAKAITYDMLRETFRNIREASGDPFRLIEVVDPNGAVDNGTTVFRPVHHRLNADGTPTDAITNKYPDGVYDFIFYLMMGMHLAPSADQDNHHMNYGTSGSSRTGVLMSELNESNIVSALQARKTYASEDRNAKMVLFSDNTVMGDEMTTTANTVPLSIGYSDPDSADEDATIRLYYYRENDNVDFSYAADPKSVFRTVHVGNGGELTLPTGPSQQYSQIPAADESISIHSGEVVKVNLPVEQGLQWVFVEIAQTRDNDKLWSAPIWIRH